MTFSLIDKRVILVSVSLFLIISSMQAATRPAFADYGHNSLHVEHFSTSAPDTDVQLHWPLNNSYSMSVDLKVIKAPESQASIFWGHQFAFMNGEIGYVAFGIGGNVKIAFVAITNALSGNPYNSTGNCDGGVPFSKTGIGWQCYVIYNWRIGANYRLQFSRLADSKGYEQWQGSVYDYSTASNTIMGSLLVPPAYGQLGALSSTWDEYSTVSVCEAIPSHVIFSYPYAMNAAGNHAPIKAQVTYGNSTCQDSNVQYLGGGSYQADAGKNVTRTTQPQTWLWTQEPNLVSQTSISEFPLADSMILLLIAISIASYVASARSHRGYKTLPT